MDHVAILNKGRSVRLSPTEAFAVYAFQPRTTITWSTVLELPKCTIQHLRKAGLSVNRIRQIQPKLCEWFINKRATYNDIAELSEWGICIPEECPLFTLEDCFRLADRCTAERMVSVGLNLNCLMQMYGMKLTMMSMMHFSLLDWVVMGFSYAEHVERLNDKTILETFNLTRDQIISMLKMLETQQS
eukprot:2356614-Rhodomonas_salina.2